MQIDGITPAPMREMADVSPSKKQNEAKLKEACEQFESLFLTQMLKEMKKSVPKADGEKNSEQETYNDMMYEEIAKSMASSGGVGMANVLFQQVKDIM